MPNTNAPTSVTVVRLVTADSLSTPQNIDLNAQFYGNIVMENVLGNLSVTANSLFLASFPLTITLTDAPNDYAEIQLAVSPVEVFPDGTEDKISEIQITSGPIPDNSAAGLDHFLVRFIQASQYKKDFIQHVGGAEENITGGKKYRESTFILSKHLTEPENIADPYTGTEYGLVEYRFAEINLVRVSDGLTRNHLLSHSLTAPRKDFRYKMKAGGTSGTFEDIPDGEYAIEVKHGRRTRDYYGESQYSLTTTPFPNLTFENNYIITGLDGNPV